MTLLRGGSGFGKAGWNWSDVFEDSFSPVLIRSIAEIDGFRIDLNGHLPAGVIPESGSGSGSTVAMLGAVLHRESLLAAGASVQSALPPVLTGTIRDGSAQFAVSIQSTDGSAIDPSRTTWLVIHGWNSSPADFNSLVSAIHAQRPSDQILTLDWHTAADTGQFNPFDAEDRVPLVATWAAAALVNAGFSGADLNEIGHSFGSYVAGEIAELIPGGVNSIVGLDPALNVPGGYDSEGPNGVNFALYSQYSWSFHDSDPSNLLNLDGLGSPITPVTSDEAFDVANSNHSQIRDLFTYFLTHPADPVGQDFALQRLLDHHAGPWQPNQYNDSGSPSSGGGYEAVITATGGGVVPQSIVFVALPTNPAPVVNDFNGDGNSDIVWRNDAGITAIWDMNDTAVLHGHSLGTMPANWNIAGTGDFNGDGMSDLLWRNDAGVTAIWDMNDGAVIGGGSLGTIPANWHVAGTGDFNGDHMSDIVWRNDDGAVAIWDMNDATLLHGNSLGVMPANWNIAGLGDFNGDGNSDLLWRNDDGVIAIWDMNDGTVIGGGAVATLPANWHIAGTGDFNGDHSSDILLNNDAGVVAIWDMNDTAIIGGGAVATLSSNWHLSSTGDYNGDGKSDILLRNDAGVAAIWDMNDTTIIGGGAVATVAANWHIVV